jgi:hypothetical protein
MQKLTTRIEEYIKSLSPEELKVLFLKNFSDYSEIPEIFETELSLSEFICQCINNCYDDYVHYLKGEYHWNIARLIELDHAGMLHPKIEDKTPIAYSLYNAAKFFKDDEVITFLKKMGIRETFHDHFIDLNMVEDTLFGIVISGYIITIFDALILVDLSLGHKISYDFFANFTEMELEKNYDSRKNVPKSEIELKNLKRKWDYNHNYKPKNNYEEGMKQIQVFWQTNNLKGKFTKSIYDMLNDRNSSTIKIYLQEFFIPLLLSHDKSDILQKFKPFFHIVFNNKSKGIDGKTIHSSHLLTSAEFEKHNEDRINKGKEVVYDGDYNKYFNLTIKRLIGI